MRLTTILLAAALATPLAAQASRGITAPPGYDTRQGETYARNFGCYFEGRHQMCEGTLRGTTRVMTGVDYRLDSNFTYTAREGMARSWTNVQLFIGACDTQKLTSTFASNIIGTQTKVYDAKASWPVITYGKPPTNPWGTQVAFTFKASYLYTGKRDLMLDYHFRGGTMGNGQKWSYVDGNLNTRSLFHDYNLDGVKFGGFNFSVPTYLPGSPFIGVYACNDSAQKSTTAANTIHSTRVFGDTYSVTSLRGKATLLAHGSHTAPNADIVAMLTVGGNDKGVSIPGFGCYKLYVNVPGQVATVIAKTGNGIAWSGFLFPSTPIPYISAAAGVTTYFQFAWTDSVTKQPKLSVASNQVIPAKPTTLAKRCVYWNALKDRWGKPVKLGYAPTDLSELQSLPRFRLK